MRVDLVRLVLLAWIQGGKGKVFRLQNKDDTTDVLAIPESDERSYE